MTLSKFKELTSYGIDIYLDIAYPDSFTINLSDIIQISRLLYSSNNEGNSPLTFRFTTYNFISLGTIRYYIALINKINSYLAQCIPLINPPSNNENITNESNSLSVLISKMRQITSPKIKKELLSNIIDLSEYDEDLVQIPTFKVDRITLSTSTNDEVIGKALMKSMKKGEGLIKTLGSFGILLGGLLNKKKSAQQTEFLQVYEQAGSIDPACYRSKKIDRDHNAFKIEYQNELVQGLSGPYRQFFSDIANELQNDSEKGTSQLIIPTENNVNKKGEYKDKYTLNPSCEELAQYEFIGILMGISIRTGVYFSLDLCSLIWKKIVNERINDQDIKQFDEGLYQLVLLKDSTTLSDEQIQTTFSELNTVSLTDGTKIKLGKYDIAKKEERAKLIDEMVNIRINESIKQINAIKKGINKMIPLSVLNFFTWEEVECLVCGKKTVDIELLKKNTIISPELKEKEYLVKWLWEILDEFTDEMRVNFVKFCYAQESLPPNQEEYTKRQVVFTIKINTQSKKDQLPRSDTCFFFLILPLYSSKEIMKKMISIAITMDNVGMNGDKFSEPVGGNSSSHVIHDAFGVFRGALRGRGRGAINYGMNFDYSDGEEEF